MAEMVVPDDSYFMMGDHRSISSDSREFGPVERIADLRQSRVRLLAGEGCGRGAIESSGFHSPELRSGCGPEFTAKPAKID